MYKIYLITGTGTREHDTPFLIKDKINWNPMYFFVYMYMYIYFFLTHCHCCHMSQIEFTLDFRWFYWCCYFDYKYPGTDTDAVMYVCTIMYVYIYNTQHDF